MAAFTVVASHARGNVLVHYDQLNNKNALTWIFFVSTHLGDEAVILFFVLSGFLVGGKVIERSIDRSFDIKAYAVDRVSRIYTPLIPALAASGIIAYCFLRQRLSVVDLLGSLVGLPFFQVHAFAGNRPLWTLAYEIWFYVLGGFVATLIVGRGPAKFFSLCGIMFAFALFTRFEAPLLFCWCLGAFGYVSALRSDVSPALLIVGIGMTLFGITAAQYISAHRILFGSFLESGRVMDLIYSLGLAIVFAFLSRRIPFSMLLRIEKWGETLAAFSYTLYLTHFPILLLWSKFVPLKSTTMNLRTSFVFLIECASCLLFAFLLYLPFEAQTASVRRWLKRLPLMDH